MPFNTYTFFVFYLLLIVIHYTLKSWRLKKANLLIASYVFYAAWNPLFVFLLFFSSLVDWHLAKKIYNATSSRNRKVALLVSLTTNLGLLGYFKYGDFLLSNSVALLSSMGIDYHPPSLNIVLPVGISFYTFQTLSYTIDTYRGKIKPGDSFLDYALYVSFFPQLVAGPIVRANDFLPQCFKSRKASKDQIGWGLSLLTIGLFMKVLIADTLLAPTVDQVFLKPELYSSIETWAAIFAFSGQIFCDFAGYSTAAIGVALTLGFILPDNFNAPYASIGFSQFWQRWHMSLSSWLRDYLYISLGGNRLSGFRTFINLMLTMLIGGLWHGASWMFVIWGGLHGIYLVIQHGLTRFVKLGNITSLTRILLTIMTFIIVSVTWVFFRADNINIATILLGNLFHSPNDTSSISIPLTELGIVYSVVIVIFCWQFYRKDTTLECFFKRLHPVLRGLILFSMLSSIFLFASGDDRAFIYFQF